jgi:hypothetical protein
MPHGTAAILRRDEFQPLSSEEGGKAHTHGTGKAIANPLVYAAAQFLIDLYRQTGQTVKIEAFDVPHEALLSIARQLDEIGAVHAVKEALLSALKDHVMSHAGSFARAANAKPIYIALQVANGKPDFAFEQGVTEMAAIDAKSARVEGASAVNVRLTATGTATTSNIADVDKMFASVKGDKLWIQFEAPTREELDGLLTQQQVVLTAVGEAMGGAMSAAALEDVLHKIQQEGETTPEIVRILETLIEMRVMGEAGITPENGARLVELKAQVQTIIEQGIETGILPPAVALGAVQSIKMLVETHQLEQVMPVNALVALETKIQITDLTHTLETLSTDSVLAAGDDRVVALQTLIETIKGAQGAELAAILSALPDRLADLTLPEGTAPQVSRITDIAASITPSIEGASAIIPDRVQEEAARAAHDIIEVLQTLDTLELPPPELTDLMVSMERAGIDIQTLEPQQVIEVLAGKGEPVLQDLIQRTVQTLSDPAVQAALPAAVSAVTTVMGTHADMVAVMAMQSTVAELRQVIESGTVPIAQVPLITQAIEALEKGEVLLPAQIEQLQPVIDTLDAPLATQIQQAIATMGHVTISDGVSVPESAPDQTVETGRDRDVPAVDVEAVPVPVPVPVPDAAPTIDIVPPGLREAVVMPEIIVATAPVLKTVSSTPLSYKTEGEIPSPPSKTNGRPSIQPSRPPVSNDGPVTAVPSPVQPPQRPAVINDKKIETPRVNVPFTNNGGIVATPTALPRLLPAAAIASQLTSIAHVIQANQPAGQPLPAKDRVQVESLNTVAKALKNLGDGTIPPAQVVTMLTQLDTVAVHIADKPEMARQVERIREQVLARTEGGPEALPEEFKNGGRCPGCGGGDCASCGTAFETSVADGTVPTLLDTVNQVAGLDTFTLEDVSAIDETAEAGGCGVTCKRNCSTCGTAFNESVNTPSLLDTVAKVDGMADFSLNDMDADQPPASSPFSQPRLGIAA